MHIGYLIICLSLLCLSFYLMRCEKTLSKQKYLRNHKLALYIFNRVLMVVSLLCVVQMAAIYLDIKENTLIDIDVIIFAIVISSSYFLKRLLLMHIQKISSHQSIINKLKFLSRFLVLLITIYIVINLLNVPHIYQSISLISILFTAILILFIYAQERLILHLDAKCIDKTVVIFTSRVFMVIMIILFAVVVMQIYQVSTTPLLTIIGAASIAIGLSLQSSLSNLAAGILLIIFRPYKIGDVVKIDTENGVVEDINFLYTELRAFSGERLFVPNSLSLSNKGVANFTSCRYRRIELLVGVDYASDIPKVLSVGLKAINDQPVTLKNPVAKGSILDFADSAITVKFWIYTRPKDFADLNLQIKTIMLETFRKNDIEIPFNRIVVEMKDTKTGD